MRGHHVHTATHIGGNAKQIIERSTPQSDPISDNEAAYRPASLELSCVGCSDVGVDTLTLTIPPPCPLLLPEIS